MNVLSLFDGMSCGQIALNKANIDYDIYYASEIDKHAIKVTQSNYPNTIQLGDVTKWREWKIDWSSIGILLAGSPCQGFSFAGKQLAFDDTRSALFFVFVEIWEHIKNHNAKAKYILENVKMKKEYELIISKYMGINPIEINSSLLTAQNRVRLYWTNIENEPFGLFGNMTCTIPQPKDKRIFLKDVLETNVDNKYYLSDKFLIGIKKRNEILNLKGHEMKANCFTAGGNSGGLHSDMTLIVASRGRNPENSKNRESGLNTEQMLEPRFDGKTNCLTSVKKDNYVMGFDYRLDEGIRPRKDGKSPTLLARARQDIYGSGGVITHSTQPRNGKGNGGKGHLMKKDNKSYCVDTSNSQAIEYDYNIRRLTPIECERLQSVPDNYTNYVSDSQRYKMLGNGWTVDVIVYILSFMNK
jgi:DNA (cytosine-5)-methyltransferase 3A